MSEKRDAVLILGGSCFMGRHLVKLLRESSITPICINRGRIYWGEVYDPIVKVDRFRDRHQYKEAVRNVIQSSEYNWLGIVDFCAYKPKDIEESLPDEIFDLLPVYVFISTDSVYEVFDEIGSLDIVTERATDELSSISRSRDSYGWKKLKCEEYLKSVGRKCRKIFLRLPDVLGEFDDTYRLWGLKLWIDSGIPMRVSERNLTQKVSFCYAGDVAKMIVKSLFSSQAKGPYNIACDLDQCEMGKFLSFLAGEKEGILGDDGPIMSLLPSVDHRRGGLDCSRARLDLEFEPTPLPIVISKCVEWFKFAQIEYPLEYREAIKNLPKNVSQFYNVYSSDSSS